MTILAGFIIGFLFSGLCLFAISAFLKMSVTDKNTAEEKYRKALAAMKWMHENQEAKARVESRESERQQLH